MLIILVFLLFCPSLAHADIDIQKLANAIYKAEGMHSRHPYGILVHFKTTTPRQACINTINHQMRMYKQQTRKEDFISFLAKSYCPIGAKNDPTGLNKNWVSNVKRFYNV